MDRVGHPAIATEPLVCETCGRACATFIPRHGNGTARRVAAHYTEPIPRNATWMYRRSRRCPGRWAKGWAPDDR